MTMNTWFFMVIILGIVVFETLFEGLNGITPQTGGGVCDEQCQ